jgi:prevent-host-death family protein
MIQTNVSDAKKRLSELIGRVMAGESVIVTKRGKPVARIDPIRTAEIGGDEAVIAELEAIGLLRQPTDPGADPLPEPPIELDEGVSVLEALLEERETGW